MDADLLAALQRIEQRLDAIDGRFGTIDSRLDGIETRISGFPLIGEAISVLQRDIRLVRAAVNDIGKTNITAGEVEAMHTDIDRDLAELRDLAARVASLEGRGRPSPNRSRCRGLALTQ
ncbi:MAG: hypothetical protein IT536_13545 [Hyphomicrobiales bacterium]|nr:hypothetical protein [Hyphomicrobiales bacterium]